MGDATAGSVRHCATQFLVAHFLAGNRPYDVGSGDVHLPNRLHHEDEVRDGGRIHRSSGRGACNHRYLGHNSRRERVSLENLGISVKGIHPLLDTGSA